MRARRGVGRATHRAYNVVRTSLKAPAKKANSNESIPVSIRGDSKSSVRNASPRMLTGTSEVTGHVRIHRDWRGSGGRADRADQPGISTPLAEELRLVGIARTRALVSRKGTRDNPDPLGIA